jgi:carboxypeptidase family protein
MLPAVITVSRWSLRPGAGRWAFLWLALPLAVPAPPVEAGPPLPGVVLGSVLRADDGAPVPYAAVGDTARRIGAITDEQGRFLIAGIPPGRITITVRQLGSPPLFETLELAPGDTLRRTYRLAFPERERLLRQRDSLTAIGAWPPTLDPTLHQHMREALDVRVFRLDPEHPAFDAPRDPERRIGPWPIVGETGRPPRPVVEELIGILCDTELYRANAEGAIKLCGGFSPGIDVRFTNLGVPVDLLLCYTCGEFAIWHGGRMRQSGDFESRGPDFVRFAKRMFPRDPVIKRLGGKPKKRSR